MSSGGAVRSVGLAHSRGDPGVVRDRNRQSAYRAFTTNAGFDAWLKKHHELPREARPLSLPEMHSPLISTAVPEDLMNLRARQLRWLLWLGTLLLSGAPAFAGPTGQAGPYHVEITTDPPVVPVGKARLLIRVTDSAGKPVEGAEVRAIAQMPGMAMGEQEGVAAPQPGQPGVYAMPATFAMEGAYTATVKISSQHGPGVAQIPLKTGQNTAVPARGGGFSPLSLLPWLLGLGAGAFVLFRVWRSGQRPNWRGIFNRQVLGGLVLVALMLAGATWAVRTFRRPGAMTPLEAQGMQMSTPAPPGAAPVELAPVTRGAVESTVRYTGQAAGFLEQDVTPRVRGYITWMPFYAGDRVRRGQVLARLDPSEVAPQVAERRAAVAVAEQGAGVARADLRQALAVVSQAQAGVDTRKGAVAEARSQESRARGALREAQTDLRTAQGALAEAQGEQTAAREEGNGAQADVATAQAQVPEAEAQLQAARADQQYWTVQLGRTRVLLTQGAVSDEEFRRDLAQAENADAKVHQAQARIEQVRSQVRAAQSRVRKAEALVASATARAGQAETRIDGSRARIEQAQADIAGAAARVQQATAEVEAQRATVRQAEAAANAARQRVAQAESGIRQARASLGTATTAESYTAVYSQLDGVVLQRVVSPGTLVNPGQSLLRVAQISPIRLQANVAETDLARIRVGAPVRVGGAGDNQPSMTARVTSIAPAVDPAARTGIVEAVVPNRDGRFLPGRYVVMDISTGRSAAALSVPAEAIRWHTNPSSGVISTQSTAFVWVAEPLSGQEGQYTVRPAEVQVGLSNGARTEILAGLQEGQQVVVSGHDALKSGDTVATVTAARPGEGGAGAHPAHGGAAPAAKQLYTCPMHPEIVRDRPGKCPKCGMELVPKRAPAPEPHAGHGASSGSPGPEKRAAAPPGNPAPGRPAAAGGPSAVGRLTPAFPNVGTPAMGPVGAPMAGAAPGPMGAGMAPRMGPGPMGGGAGMGSRPGMGTSLMGRAPGTRAAGGGGGGMGVSGMGGTGDMGMSGGVPGLPPRGGVPVGSPPGAGPAPRSTSGPGMGGSGAAGMSAPGAGRAMGSQSGRGTSGGMSGMGR